jgi:hypothetical protein
LVKEEMNSPFEGRSDERNSEARERKKRTMNMVKNALLASLSKVSSPFSVFEKPELIKGKTKDTESCKASVAGT